MSSIKRNIGKLLYNLVGKNMPVSDSSINVGQKKFRRFCFNLMINSKSKNVNIEKGASFSSDVKLGDNSGIGINAIIASNVAIGKNVMMGPECKIYTINHEFKDKTIPMCEQGFTKAKPVIIGNDVWIGASVIILPGVKIGDGCILGAGTVVTKSTPDFSIVCGNPGKVVKYR